MGMMLPTRLEIEVLVNFQLSPHQVGLLPPLGESPPASTLQQTPNELRVITFSHIHFESSLLCDWGKENVVRKSYFPNEIPIKIPFKRRDKCFNFRFTGAHPLRSFGFS